jgi:ABC-type sugar transport system, periplasmic component
MRKNLLKRVGTLTLAGILAFSMTACSSDTDKKTDKKADKNEQQSSAQNSVDELYWFSDVSGWGPETANWSVKESPATKYIEGTIGLKLKIEQPPTDAATKLGLMIATADLPDLMSITDNDVYKQLVEAGKVWDLKSFLEKYDPESHLLKDFPSDVKQALTDTYGDWYSYPSHMESTDNRKVFPPDDQIWLDVVEKGANGCIMFNQDIMKELGISQNDVQTEDGFLKALEKVKKSGYQVGGQDVIPVMLQANLWISNSLDNIISWNFGVLPVDQNGIYRHKELDPGYKNALKFVNTMVTKGYVDVNSLTIDETALKTYLDAKRVFCWIGNQAAQDKAGTSWTSFGPILASNGAKPVLPVNKSAGTGWIQTLVSKDCKNPEKIAKLLSWVSSKEGLLVNYYGENGTDYTLDDKGVVTRTEEGNTRLAKEYDNNILFWPFANTSFERNTEAVPDPATNRGVEVTLMPALGKYKDTYIYDSSLLSFENGNVIEPSSDLGISLNQIKSYLESQKAKIVTAASDEEFDKEYQNMIKDLNDYGVKEIDEAYNKIYQDYCQKKGETIEDVNASLYK